MRSVRWRRQRASRIRRMARGSQELRKEAAAFPKSWLPCEFVPCCLREARFPFISFHVFPRKLASLQVRLLFVLGSWLPRKFVPCFSREAGFPVSSFHVFSRNLASPQVRSMFFPGSWFPHKFVPCFSQKVGFPVSFCRVTMPSPVSDIDLQMKLEADSVHDGLSAQSGSTESDHSRHAVQLHHSIGIQ